MKANADNMIKASKIQTPSMNDEMMGALRAGAMPRLGPALQQAINPAPRRISNREMGS